LAANMAGIISPVEKEMKGVFRMPNRTIRLSGFKVKRPIPQRATRQQKADVNGYIRGVRGIMG